ncbi:MAG: hypothetical protein RLZZ546_2340, partial [Bacteroidota bacterium]
MHINIKKIINLPIEIKKCKMGKLKSSLFIILLFLICTPKLESQSGHSIARQWNELMLLSIKSDLARPTVHARNLFHTSAAMYDAWAVF